MERSASSNGPSSHARVFKNSLLRSLEPAIIARLHLKPMIFELGQEIEFPGQPIAHLFFVEEGMASITTTFEDGDQVEVGMFGYESIIGISGLMGTKRSLNRVYTQIAGSGYSCSLESGKREFQLGGAFHEITLRYVQAQLVLALQSAGCNAKHEIDQRLVRWLLICSDRANSDSFTMSHEYLATMLGSSRPTVSVAAAMLKKKGLISYSRGKVRILDQKRLEEAACECYHVIKDHLNNYADFDSGLLA